MRDKRVCDRKRTDGPFSTAAAVFTEEELSDLFPFSAIYAQGT